MARQLVTDKELHNLYPQLSLWTINELRRRGNIPVVAIPGIRKYLFDLEAIENWITGLQQVETVKPGALKVVGR